MNDDIEFTVGLDISPTEQKLNEIQNRARQLQTQLSASRGPSITKNLDKQETKLSKIEQQLSALMQGDPKNLTATKLNTLQKRLDTVMKNLSKDNKLIKPAVKSKDFITDNVGKKKENEKETEESLTDQLKKQGKEHSNNLALLSKKLLTLYAIKKVVDAIVGAWKGFGNITSGQWANINKESGFFSVDPVGALRANRDKTRALLYAGIRNWGKNAPITENAIDAMSEKFTDVWTAAVSGRQVDKQTTIDIERLGRYFGIDMTPEALLTGQRNGKTATDLMIDAMNKVEKGIGSLQNLTEVEMGQVIDSIKNIFGREIADALVANVNKNKKLEEDNRQLLTEKIMTAGGTAIPSGNLTESTDKAVTSMTKLNTAVEELRQTLVVRFTPKFVTLTGWLEKFVGFLERWLNVDKNSEKDEVGIEDKHPLTVSALINSSWSKRTGKYHYFDLMKGVADWAGKSDTKADKKDVYRNKAILLDSLLNSNKLEDVLSVPLLDQTDIKNATDVEGMHILNMEKILKDAFKSRFLDPNSTNPIISGLANYTYNGKTGFEALAELYGPLGGSIGKFFGGMDITAEEFEDAMQDLFKQNVIRDMLRTAYGEGGIFDFNTGMNVFEYLFDRKLFANEEDYLSAITHYVNNTKETGAADKAIIDYIDKMDVNKDGTIDTKELRLILTVGDLNGNSKTVTIDNLNSATINAIK